MDLYTQLGRAHQTLTDSVVTQLKLRDRLDSEIKVRTGAAAPNLDQPLPTNPDTQVVIKAFRVLGLQIEVSRLIYGTVDRFLRIDVVDLDDVKAITSRAAAAFKEK